MSTQHAADKERTDRYTYHTEPRDQGGERYVRCSGCGRECIPADSDRILHADDCPEADR